MATPAASRTSGSGAALPIPASRHWKPAAGAWTTRVRGSTGVLAGTARHSARTAAGAHSATTTATAVASRTSAGIPATFGARGKRGRAPAVNASAHPHLVDQRPDLRMDLEVA